MNLFDVLTLGIVIFCLLRGMFRGLIKEGVAFIGVFVGFCVANHYYAKLSELLSYWISDDLYSKILGFFSIFLGIVIINNVLISMTKYIIGLNFTRRIDRSFGGGIGITKGIIVSSILLIIFAAFLPKGTSIISDSQLLRHLTPFSEKLVLVAPKEMKHEFFEKIESYKKAWKNHK